MATIMIRPCDYETVEQAVAEVFERFPLPIKGKRVLLKPNVLRSSEAEEGIVTHPAVLQAVVKAVEQRSPVELVVGDNPGLFSYGANEESFEKTGLMAASRGHYKNIGNESVPVAFNPAFMETVGLSRAVVEADIVISLPKFKTHGLTVVTGAIKNSYGFLPGAQKARLHQKAGSPARFNDLIAEIFALRVPDLFIVDAVVAMEGNGPASPDLRKVGLLLAADNGVALDAAIAAMMGLDPGQLRFLQRAAELGLGDYDLTRAAIVGDLVPLPDFKLPPLSGEALAGNQAVQELIHSRSTLLPEADPQRCTSCGSCMDHCPVAALSMVEDLPKADPALCITCFCCQELCPEKAITLTTPQNAGG
ncbi:MAG: DUF362 domain-containing protein [Desulfobacterales bacterium]|nr:DUF362 domain-containing protein [Desulfobacterales bacterium]